MFSRFKIMQIFEKRKMKPGNFNLIIYDFNDYGKKPRESNFLAN